MPLQEGTFAGRTSGETVDKVTGLRLQDPAGINQTQLTLRALAVAEDDAEAIVSTQYGQPFIAAYCVVLDDLTGGRTATLNLMDPAEDEGPNGPAPFKFRILRWWVKAGDIATAPEGTLTINHLSTASAANAMCVAFDLDLDQNDLGYDASGTGTLIAPYDVVAAGEGIQISVLLGSTEQADFTIFFECMRVVA